MGIGEKFQESWAETFAVLFILIGFVLSLLLMKAFLVYLVIFLVGFLAGRIVYIKRFEEPIFPFILMILGFLFGYMLGSFWSSRLGVLIFFIVGLGVSYFLHLKKILVIFKSREFLK